MSNASWFRRQPFSRSSNQGDRLLSSEQLLGTIEREQSRTGRTGSPFCLVHFRPAPEKAEQLAGLLADERRCTDVVGWFKEGQPSTLLVETLQTGAEIYARRILGQMGGGLDYEVKVYPSSPCEDGPSEPGEQMTLEGPPGGDPQAAATGGGALLYAPSPPLWKSVLDRILAVLALILLAPLFAVVAVWIKATSPGPVFFQQDRVGLGGRHFRMWKFRSLEVDSSHSHKIHVQDLIQSGQTLKKMDSVLPVIPGGRFLRAACIDELPQLFNVLLGHMSLVGPRPLPTYEAEVFRPWQGERHLSMPGLTGLWQVSGKNSLTFDEMIRLDIRYSRKRTPIADLSIMARTFPVVLDSLRDQPAAAPQAAPSAGLDSL